jgi:hypothetical protein
MTSLLAHQKVAEPFCEGKPSQKAPLAGHVKSRTPAAAPLDEANQTWPRLICDRSWVMRACAGLWPALAPALNLFAAQFWESTCRSFKTVSAADLGRLFLGALYLGIISTTLGADPLVPQNVIPIYNARKEIKSLINRATSVKRTRLSSRRSIAQRIS